MKLIVIGLLSPFAVAMASVSHSALKAVPRNQLEAITILSCEEKEPTSTVSCRSTGKCTVTIVSGRVTCKAVRK